MSKTYRVVNDRFAMESGKGNRAGIHGDNRRKQLRDERRNVKRELREGRHDG